MGRDAVGAAKRTRADVVLLDVALPDMEGAEVAKALKKRVPGVRVLAFSGYTDEEHVVPMLEAGVLGFVDKLDDMKTLIEGIHSVAAGRAFYSPSVLGIIQSRSSRVGEQKDCYKSTAAEREVLRLACDDVPVKQIAARLRRSAKAVYRCMERLAKKMDCHTLTGLGARAVRDGHVTASPARRPQP